MSNYYQATARPYQPFPVLSGSHECQVAVIGAGYAGLATCLGLIERGIHQVCLLEAHHVAHGASGRNGGFVFGGYSLGELSLLKQQGFDASRRMYARTTAAVELIRHRINTYALECDVVDEGVIWANWFRDERVLLERARILRDFFGVDWQPIEPYVLRELIASDRYTGAMWERNALHIHPLNYAIGLADLIRRQGGRIFENSAALSIKKTGSEWRIRTADGVLCAQQVVLSCGGYLADLNKDIDRSIMPVATYVMTTEPLGNRIQSVFPGTRAAVYDTRFAFDYYRPLADTRLLWGGRISIRDRSAEDVARILQKDLVRVFPQLTGVKIDYSWSGLMGYARHEMPQIGQIEPGLWCAQGFGGHGVATTTAGGELIAAAIAQGDKGYKDYERYRFQSTYKPFGLYATQAWYGWLQFKDKWRDTTERFIR